jgi:osmotically-inducible protein OsmY
MARLFFVVMMASIVTAACSANTTTQERLPSTGVPAEAASPATPVMLPDSPADRSIRRDLTAAIARDADLQHRAITFNVTNGDISVTGIVRTEEERRKINDLAMNIDGVRSVANALRVAE